MTALSLLIGTAGLDALTLVVITYFFICAPRPDIKPARNDGSRAPTMRGDARIMFALRASICAGDRQSGKRSRAEEKAPYG